MVADAVYGDAEEPLLEAALLGVFTRADLCGDGHEYRLGDLFSHIDVPASALREREYAAPITFNNLDPRCAVTCGGCLEQTRDIAIMIVSGRSMHHRHYLRFVRRNARVTRVLHVIADFGWD